MSEATRILFVGNSYTARNDLPRLVADLAASAEPPVTVETELIAAGGASLRRHWNAGRVQAALERARWDWVVLQEQSTLPVKNPARYHDNVRLFAPEIARRGAKLALYLVWARRSALATQADLDRAAQTIAAEVGARIVPVGPAWEKARAQMPGLDLYLPDGSHPTVAGSFVAACTFVATLFAARPHAAGVSSRLGIEREVAAQLEAVALDAATALSANHHCHISEKARENLP